MRMRGFGEAAAKAIQASLICGIILGILRLVWPAVLNLLQLWLVVFVSVLANVFQPSYQPTGQGLLVKSFQAHMQQAGAPPDQRTGDRALARV